MSLTRDLLEISQRSKYGYFADNCKLGLIQAYKGHIIKHNHKYLMHVKKCIRQYNDGGKLINVQYPTIASQTVSNKKEGILYAKKYNMYYGHYLEFEKIDKKMYIQLECTTSLKGATINAKYVGNTKKDVINKAKIYGHYGKEFTKTFKKIYAWEL